MPVKLPELLTRYFAAANANDWITFAACFGDHAIVKDEGRSIEGSTVIAQWMQEAKQKYQHRAEPIGVAERDGKRIVTARVTGNFPGSPANLDHIFTLEGGRIVALEIH
jgi:hypothetical protein